MSPNIDATEADAQGVRCLYQSRDLTTMGASIRTRCRDFWKVRADAIRQRRCNPSLQTNGYPLLDALSEEAKVIGAVNTVRLVGCRRQGFNTDAAGLAASFRRGMSGAPLQNIDRARRDVVVDTIERLPRP